MKNKKKIISIIAGLALSGTMALGTVGLAACGGKDSTVPVLDGTNAVVIDTAIGPAYTQSGGNKYFVSADGGQEGADGTLAKPFSLSSFNNDDTNSIVATNKLAAGDTLYLLPGKYEMDQRLILTFSGEYNNYIRIINAAYDSDSGYTPSGDKKVTLDFSKMFIGDSNRGVQLYGDYNYWYGIDVCGAGDNGLFIAGSFNTVEYSEFYNNRDSGLQLGRRVSSQQLIEEWPSYNLIKNCTSHNNYDNESSKGENADGFAAKLTIGYGNVFDGCIAYRNSDDGWDLYAYASNGNIGTVVIYNCVAYENGFLEYTQKENNARFTASAALKDGAYFDQYENGDSYYTNLGDGNGFKLGGSVMEGDVKLYNCLSFNNRMHGVTDNSNPGFIFSENVTSYDNGAVVDDDSSSGTFGQVIDTAASADHSNIDVARQTYSYNGLNGVLSVSSGYGKGLAADAYRGSVVNSLLFAGSGKTNVVKGAIDADTHDGGKVNTSQVNSPAASDIFTTLPITHDSDYVFNVSGKKDFESDKGTGAGSGRAHIVFRNSDNSINMGDILDVKAGFEWTTYFDAGVTAGSDLNKANWGAYTHWVNEDVMKDAADKNLATAKKAADILNINADEKAVYQDFEVPSKMNGGVTVKWEVLDNTDTADDDETKYLVVGEDEKVNSIDKASYITIEPHRDLTANKTVQLKATVTCGAQSVDKIFTLTIMKGTNSIGRIYLVTDQGEVIEDGGTYIIDQYAIFKQPEVKVENGMYYSGRLLTSEECDVTSTYQFSKDRNGEKIDIKGFSASNAGVYTVTVTAELKDDSASKSMTYTIFVASPIANVDFAKAPTVAVNRDGFTISGSLSSATGTIYAVSSATELTLSGDDIKSAPGVEKYSFRAESISPQFTNDNSGSYHIYYALANLNGKITSEIYHSVVTAVDVSEKADFMTIAGGSKLDNEDTSLTIYRLTQDLDFEGETYTVGSNSFKGLLNGNGKKISNITVNGVGVFKKLSGGTIENIKFENITVNGGTAQKVGLISEMDGGFVHNVQILKSNISGAQRVGGIVGHVSESAVATTISQVYVDDKTTITSSGTRAGGIIGLFQSNSSANNETIARIYINDCLVEATVIGADKGGVGGIVGEYDPNKIPIAANCYLELNYCVFSGHAWAKLETESNKCAGMVGDHKGASTLAVNNCVSIGHLYHGTGDSLEDDAIETTVSAKNSSPLIGGTTNGTSGVVTVTNCIAYFEEYNSSDFITDIYTETGLAGEAGIKLFNDMFDTTSKWSLKYKADSTTELVAPFLTLNFLG